MKTIRLLNKSLHGLYKLAYWRHTSANRSILLCRKAPYPCIVSGLLKNAVFQQPALARLFHKFSAAAHLEHVWQHVLPSGSSTIQFSMPSSPSSPCALPYKLEVALATKIREIAGLVRLPWAAVLITLVLTTGCAGPSVTQRVMIPAHEPAIAEAKQIAVLPLAGDRRGQYTQAVETYFVNLKVQGRRYFKVLERSRLDALLAEQRIRSEDPDYRYLGRLTGADLLITGAVESPAIQRRTYKKEECLKEDKNNECIEYEEIPCIHSETAITFNLKAINAGDGEIIMVKPYGSHYEHEACGSPAEPPSRRHMIDTVLNRALAKMRRDIAPYEITMRLHFLKADDRLKQNKTVLKPFERAIDQIGDGGLSAGCQTFDRLAQQHGYQAILYNDGLCLEVHNRLTGARSRYMQAQQAGRDNQGMIQRAIQRVERKQHDRDEVRRQMQ